MHRPVALAFIGTILCCFQAALAASTLYCSSNSNGVCYRWALPTSASTSSSSDVYFQIAAPDTYQWIALAIGSQMSGAEMFVIYQDGKGNVTLSTRTSSGHDMPEYVKKSNIKLIEGSGVKNSSMIANIKCTDCTSLDLSGSNGWIAAWKQGSSLDSTDVSTSINEHDDYDSFSIDMAKVATFSSGNPFPTSESTSTNTSSGVVSGSGGGSGDGMSNAHGIIMAIAFVIAYPLGALLMPLLGKWLFHATWQMLAFIGMWVGFGLGYIASKSGGSWNKATHVKLGVAVCVLMTAQPILGWAHHKYFVAHRQRGLVSHVHIWYGRVLMSVGILNGGLGLRLSSAPHGYIVAYSIISIAIAVLYFAGSTVLEMRRSRRNKQVESYQMAGEQGFH